MIRKVVLFVGGIGAVAAFAMPSLGQITVTGVPPVRWGLSDAAIGAAGGTIEDFEDAMLAPGLSIRWESIAGNLGPVTTLPNLFDPAVNDPNGNAFIGCVWDGSRALVSPRGNQTFNYGFTANWGDVILNFDPPLRAVGFSIQQCELAPTLVVNGTSRGSLFGLGGLAAGSGRNGFVIVESYGAETISTLKIDNVGGDGFALDHVVMLATDPVPVSVTGFPWGTDDATLGIAGARIEDFEDTALVPGLSISVESPLGDRAASAQLPATFDPVAQDPFGDTFEPGVWDGSRAALNTRDNASHTYTEVGNWGDITFHFDPPVTGVGFSMGDASIESRLIVNGRDSGPLLAQAGLGLGVRQGYIRIDALDSQQPISSIRIANGRTTFNDGLIFDHVALLGLPSVCPSDFNGDGETNPDDLGDYINCYFGIPPCPTADVNADGDINPDDLGDYINIYFGPAC